MNFSQWAGGWRLAAGGASAGRIIGVALASAQLAARSAQRKRARAACFSAVCALRSALCALLLLALVATTAFAVTLPPPQITRVADDAKAIDRVVEISRGHDIPTDILRRIVNEDLDILRGRHNDDTYDFASYERMEASRVRDSFSVEPTGEDRLTKVESKGDFVYRVLLETPNRRMVVTRNRPVFVDHVEIESVPMTSSARKTQTRRTATAISTSC